MVTLVARYYIQGNFLCRSCLRRQFLGQRLQDHEGLYASVSQSVLFGLPASQLSGLSCRFLGSNQRFRFSRCVIESFYAGSSSHFYFKTQKLYPNSAFLVKELKTRNSALVSKPLSIITIMVNFLR